MKKKWVSVLIYMLLVVMISALVGGCGATNPPASMDEPAKTDELVAKDEPDGSETSDNVTAGEDDVIKVGFGLYFRNDQWWKDLEAESVKKAKELGIELLVQDGNQDANKQAGQIESFVAQGVDAIMFAPIDGSASTQAVAAAKAKGIAVITLETTLEDTSGITSQLVFDQVQAGYEIGKLAAQFMNDVHGGVGKYVCLTDPTNNVVIPKVEGFAKAMSEFCPTAERIEDVDGKNQRDPSATATENLLVAHNDLYVIFGGQTDMGLAACGVLDAKGLDASQYFVGAEGWGDEAYEALTVKKYMKAVCITPGVPLGVTALEAIFANITEGTPYQAIIPVPADIVTAENAKEYFGK